MYNPVELPSLEEIEQMDKLRQEAIESLEISANGDFPQSVRCQGCNIFVPIVGKLPRPHHDRISVLRNRISWAQ